jgi:hypothetical protein
MNTEPSEIAVNVEASGPESFVASPPARLKKAR